MSTNSEEFMVRISTTKPLYYLYLQELKQRLSEEKIKDFEEVLIVSEERTGNIVGLLNEQ